MSSYEDRMAKFTEEYLDDIKRLKDLTPKFKMIKDIMDKLKNKVEDGLSKNNLQGYSDNGLTISKKSGYDKWSLSKSLTEEEKLDIQNDLVDSGVAEYNRTSDSWAWKFS